jgi:CHAT domain-containing protein/tetratricopeptide (TPR) repeat protein
MPTAWFRYRSALALSLFFPWFPTASWSTPENQPPAVVQEANGPVEPQTAALAPKEPLVLPGAVIEEIPKGSALEKAGLQVGDVILSWERLPSPPANSEGAQGELTSYFDWLELEVEQAPRGAVVLHGRRGEERLELRVELAVWDAKVRPAISQALEEVYLAGKSQLASGDTEAAIEAWRSLADSLGGEGGRDLRAWVALRIGDAWGEKAEWRKAIQAYCEAADVAESSSVRVMAWEARGLAHWWLREFQLAGETYASALHLRQSFRPESLGVAASLTGLGQVALAREELDHAHDYFVGALQIQERQAPNSPHLANSLTLLGKVAWTHDELDLAQVYFQRALQIRELLNPQSLDVALDLNDLGTVASKRGDLNLSYDYYWKASIIFERLAPESLNAALNLNNLGSVFLEKGELDRAHALFVRGLHIQEQLSPESFDVANSLNNLGVLAFMRGELDHARDYYSRALRIQENVIPQSLAASAILNNLGNVAWAQGDLDHSQDYTLRALQIQEQLAPKSLFVATSLNNLGAVARDRGELGHAADYFLRALKIQKKVGSKGLDVALSFNNLGIVALIRGDLGHARDYHLQALRIQERFAPQGLAVANSLYDLGVVALRLGDLGRADHYQLQALRIRDLLIPQSLEVARSLKELGTVAEARGGWVSAYKYYGRALEALEHQVSRLGSSYSVQAGFRAQHGDYYHAMLEFLFRQGRFPEAFHVLERLRAQTFLTMLAERDTAFTADIPEELDRERRRLGVQYDRTLKKLAGLNPRDHSEEIEATRRELQRLDSEAGDIEARIREASPRLAALQYPHPLDTAEVQQALDPGTLLLSYSVGKDKTGLFVLSRSGNLEVKVLPLGKEALRFQVKHLLSLIREAVQGSSLGALRQQRLQAASRELYAALLAPVAEQIAASERLLIVPDGPLHALPFAVLVRDSGADGVAGSSQYLAEWKPLHVALSATVFAELKQRRHPVGENFSSAPIQIAAFGDPVYPQSLTKPKAVAVATLPTAAGVIAQADAPRGDPVVRSAAERGVFDWQPLPYTRREVEEIVHLFPAGTSRTFLGPEALEERIKTLDPKTRILHLAAHGYTDEHLPSSSFVALTIPEDTNPDADDPERDNGLLQVWEIFERVRLDADLVVLSACDTGLGDEQGGEGLIGLTRAFQYAGARTVMASLWSVQDQATSELMIRFYKHFRAGLSKDEALRQAQIELIRGSIEVVDENGEKAFLDASAPYFWAGFQIYGDWQ